MAYHWRTNDEPITVTQQLVARAAEVATAGIRSAGSATLPTSSAVHPQPPTDPSYQHADTNISADQALDADHITRRLLEMYQSHRHTTQEHFRGPHKFRRVFIGPLPISSTTAAAAVIFATTQSQVKAEAEARAGDETETPAGGDSDWQALGKKRQQTLEQADGLTASHSVKHTRTMPAAALVDSSSRASDQLFQQNIFSQKGEVDGADTNRASQMMHERGRSLPTEHGHRQPQPTFEFEPTSPLSPPVAVSTADISNASSIPTRPPLATSARKSGSVRRNESQASFATAQSYISARSDATVIEAQSNDLGSELCDRRGSGATASARTCGYSGSSALSPIPGSTILNGADADRHGKFAQATQEEGEADGYNGEQNSSSLGPPSPLTQTLALPRMSSNLSSSRRDRHGMSWFELNAAEFSADPNANHSCSNLNHDSSGGDNSSTFLSAAAAGGMLQRDRKRSCVSIVDTTINVNAEQNSPMSTPTKPTRTRLLSFEQPGSVGRAGCLDQLQQHQQPLQRKPILTTSPLSKRFRDRERVNTCGAQRAASSASFETLRPVARRGRPNDLFFWSEQGNPDASAGSGAGSVSGSSSGALRMQTMQMQSTPERRTSLLRPVAGYSSSASSVDPPTISPASKSDQSQKQQISQPPQAAGHSRQASAFSNRSELSRRRPSEQRSHTIPNGPANGFSWYPHRRDASRMSHVSTIGSLGTHGTRATEGSFGAVGGVRARLFRGLLPKADKERRARDEQVVSAARAAAAMQLRKQQQQQAEKEGPDQQQFVAGRDRKGGGPRHYHYGLHRSAKPDPFQVGTSSGGTRWVGSSFETGFAVEEVLLARIEASHKEKAEQRTQQERARCMSIVEEEKVGQAAIDKRRRKGSFSEPQDLRRPSAALAQMTREANLATHSREGTLVPSATITRGSQAVASRTVIDTSGKRRSRAFDEASTSTNSIHMRPKVMTSPKATIDSALSSSCLTLTQAHGVNHAPAFDIESRKGWADIAAMMNAHSGRISDRKPVRHAAADALASASAIEKARTAKAQAQTTSKNPSARPPPIATQDQRQDSVKLQVLVSSPKDMNVTGTASTPPGSDASNGLPDGAEQVKVATPTVDSSVLVQPEQEQASVTTTEAGERRTLRTKKSVQFARNSPSSEATTFFRQLTKPIIGKSSPMAEALFADVEERAAPEEVLQRSEAAVQQIDNEQARLSQLRATAATQSEELITHRSVLKRDRMLVKIEWTAAEDLPPDYDELIARRYSTYEDDWSEYMVVLRMGRLELWEDTSLLYKLSGRAKQLKLRLVLGLRKGHTFQSLYSPIDGIFCLTYTCNNERRREERKRSLHLRKSGTNILIFNARFTSTARDWMWELHRELGGNVPEVVDVHVPDLNIRVRIPVPDEATEEVKQSLLLTGDENDLQGEGYKLITTRNITEIIARLLQGNPRWLVLAQQSIAANAPFEVAWRIGRRLEWVHRFNARHDTTISSDAAVVSGVLLHTRLSTPVLELRPAQHHLGIIKGPVGDILEEPPAAEGYLWRVKAVSGSLTRVYVSTHDGHIFFSSSSKAFAPDKEIIAMLTTQSHSVATKGVEEMLKAKRKTKRKAVRAAAQRELDAALELVLDALRDHSDDGMAKQVQAYRAYERCRQFEQIVTADGYVDLRDILKCERVVTTEPEETPQSEKADVFDHSRDSSWQDVSIHASEDIGGEEGLAACSDRAETRARRQIEVTMSNGRYIRFEAFSTAVAEEWVVRINQLVRYWKARERSDAKDLMAIATASTKQPGTHSRDSGELDRRLPSIWSWCPIMNCRPIVRCGRLFRKMRTHEAFNGRYFILIQGRLLSFKLMQSTKSARARQNAGIFHKRQETVLHLRDAYVYSGKLTEDFLPEGNQAAQSLGVGGGGGDRHRLPRVYQDGLQSVDDEEDCTFVIRYRPQCVNATPDPIPYKTSKGQVGLRVSSSTGSAAPPDIAALPSLNDGTISHIVLRARSQMERDLWVKAISWEIERLCKDDGPREYKLRNKGITPYTSLS
ncbi:hypothetical protein K437DRAFT_273414 [Tilletiaria anomala UBC 951]|uniref:PH domain-containing protein n=1 Tax=Tilletiaria anomala (strain ATCC 24038 / CBS 436.72 / UBC 951) TaxID=1037660 RepID=A0A066W462_TILAU|nr:uncharacterized protein K437DRAFT_273414 [Tilletiaria anomala UBC 951]KDN48526.1 hypothetical protein K437DRAFT_273414 [Tilletiaria anomala UBC 951]